jgi:hypothetical protein
MPNTSTMTGAQGLSRGFGNASESTPLLVAEPIPIDDSAEPEEVVYDRNGGCIGKHGDTPLPMKQILLLCYARMVEPIAFFGIFPFISMMIQEAGHLDEADVGYYSGLIVIFYIAM